MKKFFINLVIAFVLFGGVVSVSAAPIYSLQRSILPESTNTYYLGSTSPNLQWNGIYTKDLTVTGTCTGCGGGGGGSDTNWSFFNGSGIKLATTTNQVLIGASATTSNANLNVVGSTTISGNVGIGTTNPNTLLNVIGNSNTVAGLRITANNVTDAPWIEFGVNGVGGTTGTSFGSITNSNGFRFRSDNDVSMIPGSSHAFRVLDSTAATTYFTVLGSNGNVGIGTTTPSSPFTISSTAVPQFKVDAPSGDVRFQFSRAGTGVFLFNHDGTLGQIGTQSGGGNLALQANGSIYQTITTTGNVGIGTTTPGKKLTISGGNVDGISVVSSNAGIIDLSTTASTGRNFRLATQYGAAAIFEILRSTSAGAEATTNAFTINGTSGNVGIGTTSPNALLGIQGAIGVNSSQLYLGANGAVGIGDTTPTNILDVLKTFDGSATIAVFNESSGASSAARFDIGRSYGADYYGSIYYAGENNSILGPLTFNIIQVANAPLVFHTSNAARMTVTGTGNVGIGATSPGSKLVVTEATGAVSSIPALGAAGGTLAVLADGGLYGLVGGALNTGNFFLQVQRYNSTAVAYNLLLQPSGGNVGIGTTTPYAKLSVVGETVARNFTATSTTDISSFQKLTATHATSTSLGVTNLVSCDTIDTDSTGSFRCGTDGGGGTNYLTNSGTQTYLNTGSNLSAPYFTGTSTATSTFAGPGKFSGRTLQVGNSGVDHYVSTGGANSAFVLIDKPNAASDAGTLLASNGDCKWETGMAGDSNYYFKKITGSTCSGNTFESILKIDYATGRFGIGTEAPSSKFEVASSSPTARVDLRVTNKATSGTDGTSLQLVAETDNHVLYLGTDAGLNGSQNGFLNWGAFGTGLFLDSSGNIGIQTATITSGDVMTINGRLGVTTANITSTTGTSTISNALAIGSTTPTGSQATLSVKGTVTNILQLFTSAGVKIMQISNAGVATLLGAWDFGGADSVEIPNASSPTVDAAGEIALDTTDNQLLVADSGNAVYVASRKVNRIVSFALGSTSPAFVSGGVKQLPIEIDGYTVTAIRCNVEGGTNKAITLFGETITCLTTATSDDGSILSPTSAAAALNNITMGATSGSVNFVNISIFGTWTRE